ncbi:MAG: hypothetical protein WCD21_16640 [Streptomyces sp.]
MAAHLSPNDDEPKASSVPYRAATATAASWQQVAAPTGREAAQLRVERFG